MGCCESAVTDQQQQILAKEIKLCIQSNNIPRIEILCKSFTKGKLKSLSINSFRFKCLKSKLLNIPAYCFLLNKPEIIKFLAKNFKIDFKFVEKIMKEYDICLMTEICLNNYLELLEFYLPYYLQIDQEKESIQSNFTLDLQSRDNSKFKIVYSPIQAACEKGHIQILNYVYKYFENSSPPLSLNINVREFTTGENCALIACRLGNFPLIKFLHLACKADFFVTNNKNESAIQILASSSKKKYNPYLYNALVYLVEKVGVDILHGYEETLLILENSECVKYVEEQLALKQIFVTKLEIEYRYRLIKRNSEEGNQRDVVIERNSLASSIGAISVHFSSLSDVYSMLNK